MPIFPIIELLQQKCRGARLTCWLHNFEVKVWEIQRAHICRIPHPLCHKHHGHHCNMNINTPHERVFVFSWNSFLWKDLIVWARAQHSLQDCTCWSVFAVIYTVHLNFLSYHTVELQWLEPRWLVYHGWVEHVLVAAGISSKYDIRIILGNFLLLSCKCIMCVLIRIAS